MEQRNKKHQPREKSDGFKDKVLDLRRVTRVVAGGKRFRFRVAVAVGDEKGKIGLGIAKGSDVAQAVEKARLSAKKNIVSIKLQNDTIAHEVDAKFGAARVKIKPAVKGHGLRAGGAVRTILALAGVKDATAKVLGNTSNQLTNASATINALQKIKINQINVTASS